MDVYSWPGTELDFRKPWLTPIKLCVLPLNSPIRLLYHYISFFFFFVLLSQLLMCWLFCLSRCSSSLFLTLGWQGRDWGKPNLGGRNGGLEPLFNLGQTCVVPHSPHSTSPALHPHHSIHPSVYLRWSFKCLKLMDSMSVFFSLSLPS